VKIFLFSRCGRILGITIDWSGNSASCALRPIRVDLTAIACWYYRLQSPTLWRFCAEQPGDLSVWSLFYLDRASAHWGNQDSWAVCTRKVRSNL